LSNNFFKWLYPGIKVKRWAFTSLFGVLIVGIGSVFAVYPYPFVSGFGIIIVLCGVLFIVLGMGKMIISLITLFLPQRERDIVDILYQRRFFRAWPQGCGHRRGAWLITYAFGPQGVYGQFDRDCDGGR